MNSTRSGLFIVFYLLLLHGLFAQAKESIGELREQAATLYYKGDYESARGIWHGLVHSGYLYDEIFYNIGNAESMMGNFHKAILAYEKAYRLKPGNNEIVSALNRERKKIENATIPIDTFFLVDWYKLALSLFRPWLWTLAGLLFILSGLIKWYSDLHIMKQDFFRFPGKAWMYFAMGIWLILLGLLSYHSIYRRNEAIVFSSCEFRQAPSANSPEFRMLHKGEKVRITDEISGWNKVNLLNMDEGWIKKDCLVLIDLSSPD